MFSTKARYALRIMIDLAQQSGDEYIPLKDVATRQGISKKYLEIIAKELVTSRLLTGASGKHGGYKLTRAPEDYSVGEIIETMEGPIVPVACLEPGAEECPRRDKCHTVNMWMEFTKLEQDFFHNKKLSDLL